MGDVDAIRQKIIEELLEASESSLDPSEIEPGTNLRDDLGLDSLQAVTVVMAAAYSWSLMLQSIRWLISGLPGNTVPQAAALAPAGIRRGDPVKTSR